MSVSDNLPTIRLNDTSTMLPSVELEYIYSRMMAEVRLEFVGLCDKLLHIKIDDDPLNRWLFDQLSLTGTHPFIRDPDSLLFSPIVINEINGKLPAPLYVPWTERKEPGEKTLNMFKTYFRAVQRISNNRPPKENLGYLKEVAKASKLVMADTLTPDNVREAISILRTEVSPHLIEYLESVIKKILKRTHKCLISWMDTLPGSAEAPKIALTSTTATLNYRSDILTISRFHYDKLLKLLKLHSSSMSDMFDELMYCCVRRYQTLFGQSGANYHAAAPSKIFQTLENEFEVKQECFASPFNAHFSTFCSAFPDVDQWFGSKGSFFDFKPKTGSFEVGPPYVAEVMLKTVKHINSLLDSSQPLSFILYVPDWRDPVAEYHIEAEKSKYLRQLLVHEGGKHSYFKGDQQYMLDADERTFIIPFNTVCYILQNEAGSKQWPATSDKLIKLEKAMMIDAMI